MKKKIAVIIFSFVVLLSSAGLVFASSSIGSSNTTQDKTYSIEEMLRYAIEDEYMAFEEYTALMAEFGVQRPFSNIIKAELYHIELVEGLYQSLGYEIPDIDAKAFVVIPESIEEALAIGVQAEINNIAMYEKFLSQELPEDVRVVFEQLRDASINHLAAFEQDRVNTQGTRNGFKGNANSKAANALNGRQNSNQSSQRANTMNIEDCLYQ